MVYSIWAHFLYYVIQCIWIMRMGALSPGLDVVAKFSNLLVLPKVAMLPLITHMVQSLCR